MDPCEAPPAQKKWELVCVNVWGIGLGLSTALRYFVRIKKWELVCVKEGV
jgi:hypothetical protein